MRTHLREPKISDRGNILIFDKGVSLDLQNEPQRPAPRQLIEAERMSAIGRMACSISHDMRHSLTAIDIWRPVRTTCCLRLITAHGILAAWLGRSRGCTGETASKPAAMDL